MASQTLCIGEFNFNEHYENVKFFAVRTTDQYRPGNPYKLFLFPGLSQVKIEFSLPHGISEPRCIQLTVTDSSLSGMVDVHFNDRPKVDGLELVFHDNFKNRKIPLQLDELDCDDILRPNNKNNITIKLRGDADLSYWLSGAKIELLYNASSDEQASQLQDDKQDHADIEDEKLVPCKLLRKGYANIEDVASNALDVTRRCDDNLFYSADTKNQILFVHELDKKGYAGIEDVTYDRLDIVRRHEVAAQLKEAKQDLSKQVPALVKLGELYLKKAKKTTKGADFTKANALYNAALVRSRKVNHEIGEEIGEEKILRGIVETYREFLRASANGEEVSVNEIQDEIRGNKDWIKNERQVFEDRYYKMDSCLKEDKTTTEENDKIHAEEMEELFRDIQDMYVRLVSKLVKESERRLGKPPCDYAIIALGSVARMEATPYSDLEFAILYSEPAFGDKVNYFRVLTHFLHLKVINLGETILPALGIEELIKDSQSYDSWFYDSETPRGISFDGAIPWASKTPLGRMATNNKPPLELISTPKQMAEFQDEEIAMKEGYHLADIMSRVSLLYGEKYLLDEYNKCVENKLNAKSSVRLYPVRSLKEMLQENTATEAGIISRPVLFDGDETKTLNAKLSATGKTTRLVGFVRGIEQMLTDIRKYDPHYSHLGGRYVADGVLFDVKKQLYRLISLLVSDLGMIFYIRDTSPWQVISQLLSQGIIGKSASARIKVCLSIANEMRLKTYFVHKKQKEPFSCLSQYANTTEQFADAPTFRDFGEDVLVRLLSTGNDMHKRCREFCNKYLEQDEVVSSIFQNLFVESSVDTNFKGSDSSPTLMGNIYLRLGNLPKALEWVKKESKDSLDYGNSLNFQGLIYSMQQEYHNSHLCLEKAEEHFQNSTGLVGVLHNHALALHGMKQDKKAIIKIEEAIVKHNEICGEGSNTIDLCVLKKNLGMMYYNQGDTSSAIETLQEVEEMQEELGKRSEQLDERSKEISGLIKERIFCSIDVLQQKILLAQSFSKLDKYEQSLYYIQQAEELIHKLFGKNDVSHWSAYFYSKAAKVYESCHRGDKAVYCYEKRLKLLPHLFGDKRRETIHCLCSLGRILCDRNQTSEAVEHLESALKQARILYGEKPHLDVAEILNMLGEALSRAGKLDKSHSLFREAEKMMDQIPGPNHAHSCTAKMYNNMAAIYTDDLGDLDKAKEYVIKAVDMQRKILNSRNTSHLYLVISLNNLSCACMYRGEQDEALKHLEEAREIAKDAGIKHYVMLQVLFMLRDLYYDMKCVTKSKMCYQEAIEIAKSLHEDDTYPPSILERIKLLKEVTEIAEDAGNVSSDQKASSLQVRDPNEETVSEDPYGATQESGQSAETVSEDPYGATQKSGQSADNPNEETVSENPYAVTQESGQAAGSSGEKASSLQVRDLNEVGNSENADVINEIKPIADPNEETVSEDPYGATQESGQSADPNKETVSENPYAVTQESGQDAE